MLSNSEDDQSSEGMLEGVRVLLVDDSAEVLETMKLLLEMELADVNAFTASELALEAAQDSVYQCAAVQRDNSLALLPFRLWLLSIFRTLGNVKSAASKLLHKYVTELRYA
ncbi:hypothetical protein [Pseudomonas sp. Pseu.R1]|uniref:hypothetical protein n=1 Tax=Pseudomonas sp. Pseu.R1 TaxID=3379818 RepID=UPI003B932421